MNSKSDRRERIFVNVLNGRHLLEGMSPPERVYEIMCENEHRRVRSYYIAKMGVQDRGIMK